MASVKLPNFPSVDFSKLDLSKLPKINVAKIDLSKLDLPKLDAEAVTNAAKDAAYVTIGFAVLAFQKAQAHRNELTKNLSIQLGSGKSQFESIVRQVRDLIVTAA